jgi:hypothetical protein
MVSWLAPACRSASFVSGRPRAGGLRSWCRGFPGLPQLQGTLPLQQIGHGGRDLVRAEILLVFNLADDLMQEAEILGFDDIDDLLLELRDPPVRHRLTAGQVHRFDGLACRLLDGAQHAHLPW